MFEISIEDGVIPLHGGDHLSSEHGQQQEARRYGGISNDEGLTGLILGRHVRDEGGHEGTREAE